jgi:hypothetical protein
VGAPFVNVEDVEVVPPQVTPKPGRGNRVQRATKRHFEKREARLVTGGLEIATRSASDPHVMPFPGEASGGLQKLNH